MNQFKKIHHRRLLSRHGFTLLEVMISTVLSSVVLVLVYSSVDVAARLSRAGTQSVVNDSVARTALFRIHDDLKTAPVSAGHYLASATGGAFTSDRFRNFVKRDEVVAPSIKVSRDFLLLQSVGLHRRCKIKRIDQELCLEKSTSLTLFRETRLNLS